MRGTKSNRVSVDAEIGIENAIYLTNASRIEIKEIIINHGSFKAFRLLSTVNLKIKQIKLSSVKFYGIDHLKKQTNIDEDELDYIAKNAPMYYEVNSCTLYCRLARPCRMCGHAIILESTKHQIQYCNNCYEKRPKMRRITQIISKRKEEKKHLKCLSCGNTFPSAGKQNRICKQCKVTRGVSGIDERYLERDGLVSELY